MDIDARIEGLSAADRAKLGQGEVLVYPSTAPGGGVAAHALGLVNAGVDRVWPVLRDGEKFADWMPRTKSSKLVRADPDGGKVIGLEIGMPFPLKNLYSEVRSTLHDHPSGGHVRRWTLERGTYRRNDGSWTVVPYGDGGDWTLVGYHLDVQLDLRVPDKLLQKAQTSALPQMYDAIRQRVRAAG